MQKLIDYIRVYDNALDSKVCDDLVDLFEAKSEYHQINGGAHQAHLGKDSRWVELNLMPIMSDTSKNTVAAQMAKYKSIYENDCNIQPPLPNPNAIYPFRLKRYDVGTDQFIPHMDAYGPESNRFLVYLWYLNDVEEGGETVFVDLDISVKPKRGSLVMFPPYWMYIHTAKPPISNPKYVINTFYMW
ncbi:2OG-Fe(II) oxygenase [Aliikangiella marina]|uniref:2OG-Fe(II) oxygenase n=1 Tax=Aliikangiella marina TaxID=1712262 RepID=A0A545TDZ2_9GAMM|nr:2OG-Fe(II) oxygenase [Aliikangiella marina]TQV75438.1 2OG-Fe(II) oxygenase [Aliikangiella marina]